MAGKDTLLSYLDNAVEKNRRGIALVLGVAALGGAIEGGKAIASLGSHRGPDKVYIAKQYDTEWSIAQKAFPGSDPRAEIGNLDRQLPHDAAHADHTVQPGDRFVLPSSSKIGIPERSVKK